MRHARCGFVLLAGAALLVGAAILVGCGGSSINTGGGDAAAADAAAADGAILGDAPRNDDAPTCTDGYRDGAETDIDCGGGTCQVCDDGFHCLVDGDCASGHCSSEKCVPAPCVDGIQNGAETDVDCGGGTCAGCEEGEHCTGGPDCLSGVCTGQSCQAPACDDTVTNGQETDIDCGGPVCPHCAIGKACEAPGDCVSQNCVSLVCATCGNTSTFTWQKPNYNVDATCATDIAGYRIYYGTAPGFYTEVHLVDLTSAACTETGDTNSCGPVVECTYVLNDLPAGLWYFAMTAYNLGGEESAYSGSVSRTIVCE